MNVRCDKKRNARDTNDMCTVNENSVSYGSNDSILKLWENGFGYYIMA
jgi:hypothetical protein